MRLRLRGPNGVETISLDDNATVLGLKQAISQATSLSHFEAKSGFPPIKLDLDRFPDSQTILETGLKLNGEQLIIESSIAVNSDSIQVNEPEASVTKAATSEEIRAVPAAPLSLQRKQTTLTDVPEIQLHSGGGVIVLRIMPDDNSCMFRALGAAVLGSELDAMTELRSLVASRIQSDPETYSEAILGKKPSEYCQWIQREDSWGGGVELAILSQQFDIEICSIDVQSLRVDRFNESRPTRCILVYSGIHYDVLALAPASDVPAEFDTKIFDSYDEEILTAAIKLCQKLQEKHYFTDTARFSVKCNQCGWLGSGEQEAVVHATESGHTDFGEA